MSVGWTGRGESEDVALNAALQSLLYTQDFLALNLAAPSVAAFYEKVFLPRLHGLSKSRTYRAVSVELKTATQPLEVVIASGHTAAANRPNLSAATRQKRALHRAETAPRRALIVIYDSNTNMRSILLCEHGLFSDIIATSYIQSLQSDNYWLRPVDCCDTGIQVPHAMMQLFGASLHTAPLHQRLTEAEQTETMRFVNQTLNVANLHMLAQYEGAFTDRAQNGTCLPPTSFDAGDSSQPDSADALSGEDDDADATSVASMSLSSDAGPDSTVIVGESDTRRAAGVWHEFSDRIGSASMHANDTLALRMARVCAVHRFQRIRLARNSDAFFSPVTAFYIYNLMRMRYGFEQPHDGARPRASLPSQLTGDTLRALCGDELLNAAQQLADAQPSLLAAQDLPTPHRMQHFLDGTILSLFYSDAMYRDVPLTLNALSYTRLLEQYQMAGTVLHRRLSVQIINVHLGTLSDALLYCDRMALPWHRKQISAKHTHMLRVVAGAEVSQTRHRATPMALLSSIRSANPLLRDGSDYIIVYSPFAYTTEIMRTSKSQMATAIPTADTKSAVNATVPSGAQRKRGRPSKAEIKVREARRRLHEVSMGVHREDTDVAPCDRTIEAAEAIEMCDGDKVRDGSADTIVYIAMTPAAYKSVQESSYAFLCAQRSRAAMFAMAAKANANVPLTAPLVANTLATSNDLSGLCHSLNALAGLIGLSVQEWQATSVRAQTVAQSTARFCVRLAQLFIQNDAGAAIGATLGLIDDQLAHETAVRPNAAREHITASERSKLQRFDFVGLLPALQTTLMADLFPLTLPQTDVLALLPVLYRYNNALAQQIDEMFRRQNISVAEAPPHWYAQLSKSTVYTAVRHRRRRRLAELRRYAGLVDGDGEVIQVTDDADVDIWQAEANADANGVSDVGAAWDTEAARTLAKRGLLRNAECACGGASIENCNWMVQTACENQALCDAQCCLCDLENVPLPETLSARASFMNGVCKHCLARVGWQNTGADQPVAPYNIVIATSKHRFSPLAVISALVEIAARSGVAAFERTACISALGSLRHKLREWQSSAFAPPAFKNESFDGHRSKSTDEYRLLLRHALEMHEAAATEAQTNWMTKLHNRLEDDSAYVRSRVLRATLTVAQTAPVAIRDANAAFSLSLAMQSLEVLALWWRSPLLQLHRIATAATHPDDVEFVRFSRCVQQTLRHVLTPLHDAERHSAYVAHLETQPIFPLLHSALAESAPCGTHTALMDPKRNRALLHIHRSAINDTTVPVSARIERLLYNNLMPRPLAGTTPHMIDAVLCNWYADAQ